MLTNEKLDFLLESYFKNYVGIRDYSADFLLKGKEYFIQALEFCENKNKDFPNLEFVATNNPDNVYDKRFLFRLLNAALGIQWNKFGLNISNFSEKDALTFYNKNIKDYVKPSILEVVHNKRDNFCIIDKFQHEDLRYGEWLSDIDLRQLAEICGMENCIITFCNLHNVKDAISNLGIDLHFIRESIVKKFQDNAPPSGKVNIVMFLEVGSGDSYSSQGIHWGSVLLTVDFDHNDIVGTYWNDLFASDKKKIGNLLCHAITYNNKEQNSDKELIHYQAFPNFAVKMTVENNSKQKDFWSCGYRAFKHVADGLPNNGNTNLDYIKNAPFTSQALLIHCYNLLLNNQQIIEKENKGGINTDLKEICSLLPENEKTADYSWGRSLQFNLDQDKQQQIKKDNERGINYPLPPQDKKTADNDWSGLLQFSLNQLLSCKQYKSKCLTLSNKILKISADADLEQKVNDLIKCVNEAKYEKKHTKEKIKKVFSIWQQAPDGFQGTLGRILTKAESLLNKNQKTEPEIYYSKLKN